MGRASFSMVCKPIAICITAFAFLPMRAVNATEARATPTEQAAGPAANASDASSNDFGWMLGTALINKPVYAGSNAREWEVRPLWSVQYKRLTLTGPRGSIGRTFANDDGGNVGARFSLFEYDRFRFNVGFRLDSGRKSGDDPLLRGLPDIKQRAIYSLNGSYRLSDQWSTFASFSSDLRSSETGSMFGLGVNHTMRVAPRWMWSNAAVVNIADNHFMQRYHGVDLVPPGSTLTVFQPSSGVRDVSGSSTLRYQIGRHWVAFGSVGIGRLLGDAAQSPLTTSKQQTTFLLGVSYNGGSWAQPSR